MRARDPDHEGFVERDGIKVVYDLYGEGAPAVFLVPSSPITHARSWKALIPYLARHLTVVTTDGRGTGRSDRPHQSARYGPEEIDADLVAVLDAAGIARPFSSPTATPRMGAAAGRRPSRPCHRARRDRARHRGRART